MDWTVILPVLGGIARNGFGYLYKALENDGKLDTYEIKQLGTSVLEASAIGFGAYFGFNISIEQAATLGALVPILLSSVSKRFQ